MTVHHLGPLTIHQFPCLSDNYGFLVEDKTSGKVAAIDTPDGIAIAEKAEKLGLTVDFIFNTHWHPDHIGGNRELVERFGAKVIAPDEGGKIAPADRRVEDGDDVHLGATLFKVIAVPGHTLGHIAYHVPEAKAVFVGDTLFSLGCGRMFEGDPEGFWASLLRLRALEDETVVFCAHEYTAANARFALSVEPENEALKAKAKAVDRTRSEGKPTVPVMLGDEKRLNPFLRADNPEMAVAMGLEGAKAPDIFAALRAGKDKF